TASSRRSRTEPRRAARCPRPWRERRSTWTRSWSRSRRRALARRKEVRMLWVAATLALAAAEPVSPAAGPVPAEIEEHYRDYNLVNAFSTAEERTTIASRHDTSDDARLARVARLMRQLASHVDEVDPGIVLRWGPR